MTVVAICILWMRKRRLREGKPFAQDLMAREWVDFRSLSFLRPLHEDVFKNALHLAGFLSPGTVTFRVR